MLMPMTEEYRVYVVYPISGLTSRKILLLQLDIIVILLDLIV